MGSFFSVQRLIIIGIAILALAGVYLIFLIGPYLKPVWGLLRTVAIPFFIALILAYLFHPLVDALMKFKMNRTLAILIIYLIFFGGVGYLIWMAIPVMMHQMKELMNALPDMEQQLYGWFQIFNQHVEQLPDGIHHSVDRTIGSFEYQMRKSVEGVLHESADWLGSLFMLFVIPFLTFYLLNDVEMFQRALHLIIPKKYRKMMVRLWRDIDQSLGHYIRGQLLVSLLVGVLAGIGYVLIDLPYGIFLALIVAVTNIIPYFGPFIGAAPALLVAIITEPQLALWVLLINVTIQILEGNFIGPYIVGKRLHIHPVFIILAILVGAELGGLIGLLLAVPIFVVLKVILVHTLLHVRHYRQAKQRLEELEKAENPDPN